jgi:hypothetical protein
MKKLLLTSILFLQFTAFLMAQPGTIFWRKISAGKNFNLAIKFDRTFWGWGANANQLGVGSFTDSCTYNPIACGGSLGTQNNIFIENDILIYPNPTKNSINIKSENTILNI